jgi:hypothetical protein
MGLTPSTEIVPDGLPLAAAEQRWIDVNKDRYNLCPTAYSQAGRTLSDAHKAKISALHTGRKRSAETRAKMSAAQMGNKKFLGKTHTPEVRARIAAAHRGRKFSDERRRLMSEVRKGRPSTRVRDEEYRRHLSEAGMGHVISAETRAKISATLKARHEKHANA